MKPLPQRHFAVIFLLVISIWSVTSCSNMNNDWRTANRDSSGLAPAPDRSPEAVVQVYAARAFNWRGIFAVHTWLATKRANAPHYTVYQVVGWRLRRKLPAVVADHDIPDRNWFGSRPKIIADLRGPAAARAITAIEQAVRDYPYPETYGLWPGPNSNTFTAFVARRVPHLRATLPGTAIGKDFLAYGFPLGWAPSRTGFQVSLFGALGFTLAAEEGVEINLLGLVFGIDFLRPALKLPFIGRIGVPRYDTSW